MTRMTGPDCAVMCNLINTNTHTHYFQVNNGTLYFLAHHVEDILYLVHHYGRLCPRFNPLTQIIDYVFRVYHY